MNRMAKPEDVDWYVLMTISFPSSKQNPKNQGTRTPNIIAMYAVANRATGKKPLVKATCTVKYLVTPEQKKKREGNENRLLYMDFMTNR